MEGKVSPSVGNTEHRQLGSDHLQFHKNKKSPDPNFAGDEIPRSTSEPDNFPLIQEHELGISMDRIQLDFGYYFGFVVIYMSPLVIFNNQY